MASLAKQRLATERTSWRKDHPIGFVAKPKTNADGSVDMFEWHCKVPGKKGTDWEGALVPCTLKFGSDFPAQPPQAFLPSPNFFHVNVFDTGHICLSIVKGTEVQGSTWAPSFTVKDILLAVQELLHTPNFSSVANWTAHDLYKKNRSQYMERLKQEVAKYTSTDDE